jgi:hypothetical protein
MSVPTKLLSKIFIGLKNLFGNKYTSETIVNRISIETKLVCVCVCVCVVCFNPLKDLAFSCQTTTCPPTDPLATTACLQARQPPTPNVLGRPSADQTEYFLARVTLGKKKTKKQKEKPKF